MYPNLLLIINQINIEIMLFETILLADANAPDGILIFLGILALILILKFVYYALPGAILGLLVSTSVGVTPENGIIWGAIIFGVIGVIYGNPDKE